MTDQKEAAIWRQQASIKSASNDRYKVWKSLLTGRGVRKRHQALIAGAKPVSETMRDFPESIAACLLPKEGDIPNELELKVPVFRLTAKLLAELDPGDSGPPILVVRTTNMPEWSADDNEHTTGCTLFVPFQDPINVGAVLRSAAAFGVQRVVLLREAAHPFHPRSIQAAGSAVFRVPLMRGPKLSNLETGSLSCFTLDLTGEPLRGHRFPEHFGLIPGLEGPGVPDLPSKVTAVHIPMAPGVESLNAATATAIALYHWRMHVADVSSTQ